MLSTTLLLAASMVVAQVEEGPPGHEHLKCYDQLIGTWCYDGPLLEDTPQAKKGSEFLAHMSFEWILDGAAIETKWKRLIRDCCGPGRRPVRRSHSRLMARGSRRPWGQGCMVTTP